MTAPSGSGTSCAATRSGSFEVPVPDPSEPFRTAAEPLTVCCGCAGHGADVKCVDWHPTKGLVVSGSKDSQQPIKFWDPKTGQSLATL